jgi:hypothetical protein
MIPYICTRNTHMCSLLVPRDSCSLCPFRFLYLHAVTSPPRPSAEPRVLVSISSHAAAVTRKASLTRGTSAVLAIRLRKLVPTTSPLLQCIHFTMWSSFETRHPQFAGPELRLEIKVGLETKWWGGYRWRGKPRCTPLICDTESVDVQHMRAVRCQDAWFSMSASRRNARRSDLISPWVPKIARQDKQSACKCADIC